MIRTAHIQVLIRNGLELAELVDQAQPLTPVPVPGYKLMGHPGDLRMYPESVLAKAAADLRHAAAELDAERMSCLGWRQV